MRQALEAMLVPVRASGHGIKSYNVTYAMMNGQAELTATLVVAQVDTATLPVGPEECGVKWWGRSFAHPVYPSAARWAFQSAQYHHADISIRLLAHSIGETPVDDARREIARIFAEDRRLTPSQPLVDFMVANAIRLVGTLGPVADFQRRPG